MNREPCPQHRWTFQPVTTSWTVRDVGRYVTDLGFRNYAKCFTENAIAGKDLEKIDAFDLQRSVFGCRCFLRVVISYTMLLLVFSSSLFSLT